MAALTQTMTRFCAGEDNWLSKKKGLSGDTGTSEVCDRNGKLCRNRNGRRRNRSNNDAEDSKVNAGFDKQRQAGGNKWLFQGRRYNSQLDKIQDQPCASHGNLEKQANHKNRNYEVIKQARKVVAGNHGKNQPRNNNNNRDGNQPGPGNAGQKQFPPEVKDVNMIYATHVTKRERKRMLREVYVVECARPSYNP